MSELIERQAVIDLLKQMRKDGDMVPWEGKVVFARIRKLPTIQPEKAQLSQQGTTSDLISRQAAIDALQKCRKHCIDPFDSYHIDIQDAENQLSKVPTVQPERKKGEWIDYTEDGYVECPFCHSATNCDGNKDELHFCFSCGADMRGEQHETD